MAAVEPKVQVEECNAFGSTVIVQIETTEGLENVEGIAGVEGVDVLLVGTNDLALEMGMVGEFDRGEFSGALERVGRACKREGKVFGIAGIYARPDILEWVVGELGVRYVLGAVDSGLLGPAMRENCEGLKAAMKKM